MKYHHNNIDDTQEYFYTPFYTKMLVLYEKQILSIMNFLDDEFARYIWRQKTKEKQLPLNRRTLFKNIREKPLWSQAHITYTLSCRRHKEEAIVYQDENLSLKGNVSIDVSFIIAHYYREEKVPKILEEYRIIWRSISLLLCNIEIYHWWCNKREIILKSSTRIAATIMLFSA